MTTIDFENLLLEKEQKELLVSMVEAARNQPRERREKFMLIITAGESQLYGLPNKPYVYLGDLEALVDTNLIRLSYGSSYTRLYDVTPLGYRYYKSLMESCGAPVEHIEQRVVHYLDSNAFEKRHSQAYAKWQLAEELLWGSDSQQQHTVIGHHCREAMQFFASSLVDQYQPQNVNTDIAKTKNRVGAVLDQESSKMSNRVKSLLDALKKYWSAVNDLAQRQEHGAQKKGEILTWEDSRRLVFQTAIVLFEIDRTLQDLK